MCPRAPQNRITRPLQHHDDVAVHPELEAELGAALI